MTDTTDPGLTLANSKTNSCYIKHRLADPIYPKLLFD